MSKFSAKVASVVLTVATSVTMMGSGTLVSVAGAQTLAELMAQLTLLQAQIAALQGNPATPACPALTRDLTVGASGADVTSLQAYMIAHGFGISAGATGYFGAQTQAAVKAWQAANGVPATGYFGPISRAKLAASCVVTPAPGPMPSPSPVGSCSLKGGAGSVNDYTLVSGLNNEEVGEDEEDVQVAGVEIEADDSSDLQLTAVRLVFNEGTADQDFEDYADEVSVWMGSEELARVDADEFNDDNDWTKTLTLADCAKIAADDTENLYVAVSGVSNLDTNDADETWTVDFDEIRFRDASGTTITEDPGTNTRTFSFTTFASANDVELKLTEAAENPEAQVVEADDADQTDNVVLAKGTLKAIGSDLEVKQFFVTVTPAGTGDASEIAADYTLSIEGDEIQSLQSTECTVVGDCDGSGTATAVVYNFDDVDYTIDEGDTVDFEITATINEIDGVIVAEGDSLDLDITSGNRNSWKVDDETGTNLANGDKTGTITGEAQTFFSVAPMFEMVSGYPDEDVTSEGDPTASSTDTGTFTFKFKVTAFGGDITVDRSCEEYDGNAADEGIAYVVSASSTNASTCSFTSTADDNPDDSGAAWLVKEGETETFTLTIAVAPNAGGANDQFVNIYLQSLNWDSNTADTSPDQFLTAGLGEDDTLSGSLYLNAY